MTRSRIRPVRHARSSRATARSVAPRSSPPRTDWQPRQPGRSCTFVAISHAVAALTMTVVASCSSRRLARALSERLPLAHQMSACVSSRIPFTSDVPGPLRRQGIENWSPRSTDPLRVPRSRFGARVLRGTRRADRLAALGDHDLFARACPFQEPGQVGLGFVDVHDRHVSSVDQGTGLSQLREPERRIALTFLFGPAGALARGSEQSCQRSPSEDARASHPGKRNARGGTPGALLSLGAIVTALLASSLPPLRATRIEPAKVLGSGHVTD